MSINQVRNLVGAAAALSLLMAGAAQAATLNFTATLAGASETPPTDSAGAVRRPRLCPAETIAAAG